MGNYLFLDGSGSTPLACAARIQSNPEIIRLLLARRADPGIPNYYGRTPLHFAAARGYASIAHELLAVGAPLGRRDSWGYTAGDWAARNGEHSLAAQLREAGDV